MKILKQEAVTFILEKTASEINNLIHELSQVQNDVQNETKSSAGDKYETSREIITQQINQNATLLKRLLQRQAVLKQTNWQMSHKVVAAGSMIVAGEVYLLMGGMLGVMLWQQLTLKITVRQTNFLTKFGHRFFIIWRQ